MTDDPAARLARERGALGATAVDSEPGSPATPAAAEPADSTCFATGRVVGGRYRIERFIARGGMGEVYEVLDEELGQRVALKAATRSTDIARDRFRREVTLARRVTHRNVCRLFEIGFEPTGGRVVPYCTMELLEGTTLSERLAKGPLGDAAARTIVRQIAAGLQAAHDVGVIHRDFKSSNILLVPDGDGRERAVISDFGLARSEPGSAGGAAAATLTTEQALLGTPAYMAPEQVECKPATSASDIYALGVVMFELVTGALPFQAETPMATAILRLKQPPPPVRARRNELPPVWDRVIARCLEVEPAQRFARAADVAAALDAGKPRRRPGRRTIVALAIAAVVAAGAVPLARSLLHRGGGELYAALPPMGPGGARTLMVADPTTETSDPAAWRGTAAGELLRAELRVSGRLRVIDGDSAARLARDLASSVAPTQSAIARLAAASPAQLLVTGELDHDELVVRLYALRTGELVGGDREPVHDGDLAGAAARLGERLRRVLVGGEIVLDADHAAKVLPATPEAARVYAEGLEHARALEHQDAIASLVRTTQLAPDFGPAYLALYAQLRAVRQNGKAALAAQRAFELAGGMRTDQRLRAEALYRESRKEWKLAAELWSTLLAVQPDDVELASSLARALGNDGQFDRCFDVLEQLRREPAPVGDDPALDFQEAACARSAGDFRRALSASTRADIKAGVRGLRDVQASALRLEGEMLANAGEYDRAVTLLERAHQMYIATGDQEGVFEAIRQLAFVRSEQGNHGEAERGYREDLQLAKQMGDRLAEGIIMNDLGQILRDPHDALAMLQQGLAIAHDQEDDRLITALTLNVGNKLGVVGKDAEAIDKFREVMDRARAQHDDDNLATAEMNLGDSLCKLGRWPEALPLYDGALASYQQRGDEDGVGFALASRGAAHWAMAEMKPAREDLEAALALRLKIGEAHHAGRTRDVLARFELAQDHAAAAEPLARAAVAQARSEHDASQLASDLVTLARALVALGHPADAIAALDEAERTAKPDPDPGKATEFATAGDIAYARALADPARAATQIPIVRAFGHRPGCAWCDAAALVEEGEIERAAGHAGRARTLLLAGRQRARVEHAEGVAARAALLLGEH